MENFVSHAFRNLQTVAIQILRFHIEFNHVFVFVFDSKMFLDFDGKFCNIFYYIIDYLLYYYIIDYIID